MNLYAILKIPADADISTIQKAYRLAALAVHPDKGGSAEAFHAVAHAFETLSNPALRNAYDCARSKRRRLPERLTRSSYPQHVGRVGPPLSASQQSRKCTAFLGQRSDDRAPELKRNTLQQLNACKTYSGHSLRTLAALERLRNVLQGMPASQRRRAMASVQSHVQKALLNYMESRRLGPNDDNTKTLPRPNTLCKDSNAEVLDEVVSLPRSGVAGVHKLGNLYRASVSVANLELYSRLQARVEGAIEHHIILVQIRNAIALAIHSQKQEAEPFDDDLVRACERVLRQNCTSAEELQLCAKVRVRASQWVGAWRISSAILPLSEAIHLRSRLLWAKHHSWENFRKECVALLQYERCLCGRRRAAGLVDRAWVSAAAKRCARESQQQRVVLKASRGVERALDVERRLAERRAATLQAARTKDERRAHVAQQQAKERLWRWHHRRDLTTEDIIRGPPVHLHVPDVQGAPG